MHTELPTLVELDGEALRLTLEAVAAISPGDLSRPTPCAEWDLEALLRHMTGQHRGFARAAGRLRTVAGDFAPVQDADVVAAYPAAAAAVADAFAALDGGARLWIPEISEATPLPALFAVGAHLTDNLLHAWDVARATGHRRAVPETLAGPALALAKSASARRGPGAPFLEELPAAPGASAFDQLLAWSGRDAGW
ncbi:MAG: TIGR03086 family metal-binding protein [Candidatus Dormibacteraceae bacterium]